MKRAPVAGLTLSVFSVAVFVSACKEDYPKEVLIDDDFSGQEEAMIVVAMSRWEEQTGQDLFKYRGRTEAGVFQRENLRDGVFIIYKVEDTEEGDAREVWEFENPGYGDEGHSGWATAGDMLIFVSGFGAKEDSVVYLRDLFGVLLHEFGHTLFLGHIRDERAVMNPGGDYSNCLTSLDLAAFCSMNGCAENYSPEDAENACRERHGERIY